MLIITGVYCTIKADVAVLVQDSLLISDTTIQNIQSTVKRLFSTLEAKDPSAIYNFAFAMYAVRRKMSPFGSKEDTVTYMDKEIKRGKYGRDLGDKNLLNRTLNKMITDRFMRSPKNTKKVSVNYGYFWQIVLGEYMTWPIWFILKLMNETRNTYICISQPLGKLAIEHKLSPSDDIG